MVSELDIVMLVKDFATTGGVVIGIILFRKFMTNGLMSMILRKLDDMESCMRDIEKRHGERLDNIYIELRALRDMVGRRGVGR